MAIIGTNKNDVLIGTAGADVIDGLLGKDTMIGGKSDDTYYVDNAGDKVIETDTAANGGGNDTVIAKVSYSIANFANVENLTLNGTPNFSHATGNALDNTITGDASSNIIDGGKGADTMAGGGGNDTYYVDNFNDKVVEGATNDIDTVISTVDLPGAFANVENYTFNTAKEIHLTTGVEANVIHGGSGNDVIDAGDGSNWIYGNAGDDTLTGGKDYDYIEGGAGKDEIDGGDGGNWLLGGAGDDGILGGAGNDGIDGGTGADQMAGGAGNDSYFVDNAKDNVIELSGPGQGYDVVESTISIGALWGNVEEIDLLGKGNLNATGNGLQNLILGNAGNNILDGGADIDSYAGGTGNDTYIVDNSMEVIFEQAGQGIDLVKSSADYTLSANLENIILTGNANIGAWGNDLHNVLVGNDGNNTLDGGKGADMLIGGKGDDTYIVDNGADKVVETLSNAAGGGYDTVVSSFSFSIAPLANIEGITLAGSNAINATGNALDNSLIGNSGANILNGGKGADTMYGNLGDDTYYFDNINDVVSENANSGHDTIISSIAFTNVVANVEDYLFNIKTALTFTGDSGDNYIGGGSGNDVIHGGGGFDILSGGAGDDTLVGGAQDDILAGGTGADQMSGGDGSDTYDVDNVKDVVTEKFGEGSFDEIWTTISINKLADNVEGLYGMAGKANMTLVGNDLGNTIFGDAGNDLIDGGLGADKMHGGKGNDTYVVDDALDQVTENANEGVDLVKSSISYALGANLENLALTGAGNIDGTGNALKNVIVGNDGNNTLDGGAGADTMIGGKGNDIFIVDNAGDKVIETLSQQVGGGHDAVKSSVSFSLAGLINVEDLILTGSGDLHAVGNALSNHIEGNSGDNLIDGGKAADVMLGHAGNDTYIVDNLLDVVLESFQEGTDTIISSVALSQSSGNVENYIFKTAAAVNFMGNALDNEIHGGSGKDHIQGGGGHDHISGNGGNDWLEGGALNDTIDGGAGADKMEGHADDDVYYVNNAGDNVVEQTGEGIDTVISTISITHLFHDVENVLLIGHANLNVGGNDLDNIIYGNSGSNVISGAGGKDEIYGQHGNDLLIGGAGADQFDFNLKGSDGHDTIKDFLKAEDILYFGVGDVNKDNQVNLADLLADVKSVVDHGAGKAVDVHFTNGAEITFDGCGVGGANAVHSIDQLVANAATQIHVV